MKGYRSEIALFFLLASCSPAADTKSAEQAVTAFHRAMDAQQYEPIYNSSDAQMKKAVSRDRFVKLLTVFHAKLGSFKNGKTVGWNDSATTSGDYVTLNRDAVFERGPATEQFIFRMDGNRASLVGYHVNSDLLITG